MFTLSPIPLTGACCKVSIVLIVLLHCDVFRLFLSYFIFLWWQGSLLPQEISFIPYCFFADREDQSILCTWVVRFFFFSVVVRDLIFNNQFYFKITHTKMQIKSLKEIRPNFSFVFYQASNWFLTFLNSHQVYRLLFKCHPFCMILDFFKGYYDKQCLLYGSLNAWSEQEEMHNLFYWNLDAKCEIIPAINASLNSFQKNSSSIAL